VVGMGVGAEPFDSDVPISCTYHRPHLKTTVCLPVVHGDIASPGKHAAESVGLNTAQHMSSVFLNGNSIPTQDADSEKQSFIGRVEPHKGRGKARPLAAFSCNSHGKLLFCPEL
jgi:hypothetical protein